MTSTFPAVLSWPWLMLLVLCSSSVLHMSRAEDLLTLNLTVNEDGEVVGVATDESTTTTTTTTTRTPQYDCASQVRQEILTAYDKHAVPATSDDDDVVVTVELIYHTVTGISEAQGFVEIFVWLTLTWNDPRLAWDYNTDDDTTTTNLCTKGPVHVQAVQPFHLKDSEIWVPEFDLYNQISGVNKLTGPMATVESNGTVTWVRQGILKAICSMENLGQIPYDHLECQLLMGSSFHRGINVGIDYVLDPTGGIKVSTYNSPYNGYQLVEAVPGKTTFTTDNHSPLLFFNLSFERGTRFYIQSVIVPVCTFTFCSILTMVVGVGAFQTLALNFTLLLVTVAQRIAVSNLLPKTNEALWIVDFVFMSFCFILVTLLETFLKFILWSMREERQRRQERLGKSKKVPMEGGDEQDPEATTERQSTDDISKSWVDQYFPQVLFTFSLRKMDVLVCWLNFCVYCIAMIVFFTRKNSWSDAVHFPPYYNSTEDEL